MWKRIGVTIAAFAAVIGIVAVVVMMLRPDPPDGLMYSEVSNVCGTFDAADLEPLTLDNPVGDIASEPMNDPLNLNWSPVQLA